MVPAQIFFNNLLTLAQDSTNENGIMTTQPQVNNNFGTGRSFAHLWLVRRGHMESETEFHTNAGFSYD